MHVWPPVGLVLASLLCLPMGTAAAAPEPSATGSEQGSPPSASDRASSAPDAGRSATQDASGASPLALDAGAIATEVFEQAAESPDALIATVRAAEIERTGLAELDPGLAATLADLEAQAAERLGAFLADAPPIAATLAAPSPAPSSDPSSAPSPETDRLTFLAGVGRWPPADDRRFDQGGSYLSSIGEVLGYAKRQIADFQPSKERQGGRLPAYESGGNRFRIDMVADRDTVTLLIEHTERYDVPAATPGSAWFNVTDSGGTTLQVDTCPDEDGTITVVANASGTYDVVGDGLTYHASLDTNDHATATVGDDAQVAGRSHALTVRGTAVGDRPGFAGGGGAVDSQLDASLTWSGAAGGGDVAPSVTLNTAEGLDTRDLRSAFTGGAFTAALVDAAIDGASQVWRAKRCLELKVEPAGRTVDPGSDTQIKVTIEHKAFDEEVQRDVTAALEGTQAVDPSESAVMAPADFTYRATDAQEGEGTITFRSVSNRGIAERSETYRVDLRLLLDVDGRVSYRFAGGSARGTLRGRGLVVKLIRGDDPESIPGVTVTGDLQVQIQATTPGCSGNGSKQYAVDAGLDASARIVGDSGDRRLSVLIRPAQPSAQLNVRVRCDGGGVTMKLPLGILFPHFEEGGVALIPLGGGQVTRSGTIQGVHSTFTFTLRREQPAR
jgi:hypothetical protein